MKDEKSRAPAAPGAMAAYRERGVFQRLHLCEYLRELAEDQGEEPAKARADASAPDVNPAC